MYSLCVAGTDQELCSIWSDLAATEKKVCMYRHRYAHGHSHVLVMQPQIVGARLWICAYTVLVHATFSGFVCNRLEL